MGIVRVNGRTLTEALERARERGGDGAVVVAQESLADGSVSISVALPTDPSVLIPAPRRGDVQLRVWPRSEERDTGMLDVRARLLRFGVSASFADRVVQAASREGKSGIHAVDAAARAIAGLVPIAASPRGGTARIAFVGSPGSGKSTAAARLALRMGRAGRTVGLIALVDERQQVGQPLAIAARTLGCSIARVGNRAELEAALNRRSDRAATLIDAYGLERSNRAGIEAQVDALCGDELRIDPYLVLSAALGRRMHAEHCELHAPLAPRAAVLTHFDETVEPGSAIEECAERALPLALLSRGPLREQDLCRANAELVADLLLRGRFE
jgi:flagellar biosynthesis protein FlhF